MNVYLDYAATSPIKPEVKKAIEPYLAENYGNPSSIHHWGRQALTAIDQARSQAAKFLNCQPLEIIFTSGGTEADNLAIVGLARHYTKPHIISTQIEHHAVLNTLKYLEKENLAEVTLLKPNSEGLISVDQVEQAVKKNTVFVSIMYVNNEIGTVQPIREIGKMVEKINFTRRQASGSPATVDGGHIYFHSDAVQAAEYQPMDVDYLHVDLLTISGHKIGAPKGTGALYVRKGTPLRGVIFGGEQERNLRPGTENVVGIVALGQALEILNQKDYSERASQVKSVCDYFIEQLFKKIPEIELNGSRQYRSPNNVNVYLKYIEGESTLLNLDLVGIGASSGSACNSKSLSPSHVLMAVFSDAERAHGSIRFTLGEQTARAEIDYVVENLKKIVDKLRDMSPLYNPDKGGN